MVIISKVYRGIDNIIPKTLLSVGRNNVTTKISGTIMLEQLKENDPDGMMERVKALPEQIREATEICAEMKLSKKLMEGDFGNVVLCGMGGSAITGDIVASLLSTELPVPFSVVRNYHLPAYVGENTLLILVSYSGNTEETISCMREGIARKAGIFGISSGGTLKDICHANKLDHQLIPKGWPPRTAVGYLVIPVLKVLEILGLARTPANEMADELIPLLENIWNSYLSGSLMQINEIASELQKRFLMVYSPPELAPAARRWMCQVNENSKTLAHWGTIPEMNHNELVGWCDDPLFNNYYLVFLSHKNIEPRIAKRIDLSRELIRTRNVPSMVLALPGENISQALMAGIYIGDILSLRLAGSRGMDPSPVKAIDKLKNALAK